MRQSADGNYNIMAPEPGRPQELPTPWLPPTYKSPRGSHNRVIRSTAAAAASRPGR